MAKKDNRSIVIVAALFIASAVLVSYLLGLWPSFKKELPKHEWQKGMCYVTWSKDKYASQQSDASMKEMARIGVKWVAIVTTWYQQKCNTNSIFPTDKTPSDESVIHAINMAHSLGMKVMLKPHLDLVDTSDGSWRGDIGCATEPDWKTWFENYRNFIVHYAKIAQANKAEMLCIGTELTSVATIKESMWKEIVIKPVKFVYTGPLTYAANWNEEFTHVRFWDMMDYVGIDAYFPLTNSKVPTLEEIKKGWAPWVKELEEFQAKVNKPIIFPEVGYCSADWTAKTPWEEIAGGNVNMELQADCYSALLETFWDKPYFFGVYWWKWGTDVRFGGKGNRGFNPQNKAAQDVVRAWYAKPSPKYRFDEFSKKEV
jgi:hypothetical protein